MLIENQTSFYLELYATICAIQFACYSLWLEYDLTTAYSCLKIDILSPPWQLCIKLLNCLITIKSMEFHYSHIYREGNGVADTWLILVEFFPLDMVRFSSIKN